MAVGSDKKVDLDFDVESFMLIVDSQVPALVIQQRFGRMALYSRKRGSK